MEKPFPKPKHISRARHWLYVPFGHASTPHPPTHKDGTSLQASLLVCEENNDLIVLGLKKP